MRFRFGGQANGISSGAIRMANRLCGVLLRTLGTQCRPPYPRDIVMNEIMFHPISGNDDDQYVELFTTSSSARERWGWRFTEGITLPFPANTTMAANSYMVVARNTEPHADELSRTSMRTNLVGNFDQALSRRGERLVLAMPDQVLSTNSQGNYLNQHNFYRG